MYKNINLELNKEKFNESKNIVEWLLDSYYIATGIKAIFIGNNKEIITPSYNKYFCSFCRIVQSEKKGENKCIETFFNRALKGNEYGFPYIYQCHAGLIEWSAPFWCNGELLGYFVSGGVLMGEPDTFFMREIEKTSKSLGMKYLSIKRALGKIKVVSKEKVKAAADILYIMANYMVKMELIDIKLRQEKYLQQAKISEEIHRIKRIEKELLEQKEEYENSFLPISSLYPLETERELLRRVRLGDIEGAREVLNEILGQILFKNAGQIELVRARILELAVVLSRAAVEAKAELEMVLGLNFKYIKEIGELKTIDELCIWIVKVLDRFTETVFENSSIKNIETIKKTKEFIRVNFKKKIRLRDIAKAIYLSPYYLSHIFKKETGSTLFEYLAKVRIEEAKRLLEITHWNTSRISMEVGYADQSYFCKIFKKTEGMSISEYRRIMYK